MSSRLRSRRRENPDPEPEQKTRESEIEIQLTVSGRRSCQVRFDYKNGDFRSKAEEDQLFDLLSLPSRIVHKDDSAKYQKTHSIQKDQNMSKENEAIMEEMTDLYGAFMTPEELTRLDAQPNPFNYSDRVSQTLRVTVQDVAIQTEPPPGTLYSANAGISVIYDAYEKDYVKLMAKKRELELKRQKEKEREKERKAGKSAQKTRCQSPDKRPKEPPIPEPTKALNARETHPFLCKVFTMERMVNQNIFDDVAQDYKYWEDNSDEYRPMEGSLLPLWRFVCEGTRSLVVSDVCWSPVYHDLFAAAYTRVASEGHGMVCLFSLKNPGIPERIARPPCGVTSVQFHPSRSSVLAVGRVDGAVMVLDVRSFRSIRVITSSVVTGNHLQPVCQVSWVPTDPGESLCFYSVSEDGRVSEWLVRSSTLVSEDIFDFSANEESAKLSKKASKFILEGRATCIAPKPGTKGEILVGMDTGELLHLKTSSAHALVRYHAHRGAIRHIAWNLHHRKVFATCALDWKLKIWLQDCLTPLVTHDLGGPVASLSWSPYSSTVIAAATDEGRTFVYDLFLRKCHPLCSQNLGQRRRICSISFNPFTPIILAGGEKGYLVTLKLSPNLRRPLRMAKGADEMKSSEMEVCKMERIIATSIELVAC